MPKYSERSLNNLKGVYPPLKKILELAIVDSPYDYTITEGLRTDKTQQTYYSWGRSVVNPNTGPIKGNKFGMRVTNKNGITNRSNHQEKKDGYGHAVDLYPYFDGKVRTEGPEVEKRLKAISIHIKQKAKSLGYKITWGGDWTNPYDPPHFEMI